jgi:hypothetical protein
LIIIEESYGEIYKLLNVLICPENKDSDDCLGINQKGYSNCWDCKARTFGIDFKFAEMKSESYHK